MKEIKHFKNNKENVDYINVVDKSLKSETIKSIKDIRYTEKEKLHEIIDELKKEVALLKKEGEATQYELKKIREVLKLIEGGLNII